MYNISTFNKIAAEGLNLLGKEKYNLLSESLEDIDGIVTRSFSFHDVDLPDSLLAVARAGAGVNNIPVNDCAEKGIVVFNTPGANANSVKELVLAGMLLSARNIIGGVTWAR